VQSPEVASVVESPEVRSDSDAGNTASTPWPLPRTVLDHLTLESARATIVYWVGVFMLGGALFIPKLLPCVDYPQHLALGDMARRLADSGAPEQATHQLNYFTYNGLFHLLVAKLARVMPIEMAGRIVVAFSLVLLGAGVVALLKVLRRPPSYAALFTPLIFSFSAGWGFANYALGTAVSVVGAVFVARSLLKPTIAGTIAAAAVGLLCAFAHVLGMLTLCVTALALAPELAWRATTKDALDDTRLRHALRAVLRITIALAPLLIGCAFCVAVYAQQYEWDPNMYRDPTVEGTAPPLWQKVGMFTAFASNLYGDRTDHVMLSATLLLLATTGVLAWRRRRGKSPATLVHDGSPPPLLLPLIVLGAAYLATPMVLIGTHLIFPRLAQGVVLGAILAAPSFGGAMGTRIARGALAIGVLAGLNLVVHTALYARETDDASRVIDDLPEGRGATAVIWDPGTLSFHNGTLTHLAAYYGARKHGTWAFSFARYLSVPVRFKSGSQPAWPKKGWEFSAWDYNPRCGYARAYDLVIVKAPADLSVDGSSERTLRHRVFGRDESDVKLLSHHGKYWAFDTAGIPADGTP
jgi:hypothetical protein